MHKPVARSLMAFCLGAVLCTVLSIAPAAAKEPQEAPPTLLRFDRGQAEVEVRGTITGYQTLDYTFDGAPGSEASVRLDHADQASLYHNVIAPSGAPLFTGSVEGDRFQATLRERGRYRVRVYLMRNDARRGKRVPFTLRIRQSAAQPPRPLPPQASGPSFDCRKARGAIETAICRSPSLSELDGRLDFVYRDALAGAPSWRAAEIRREQRRWLDARASCTRERALERCLDRHYTARIGQLEPKR